MPTDSRQMLKHYHQTSPELAGKKVLIVDDDVRNVFALANMLEFYQILVLYAEQSSQLKSKIKSQKLKLSIGKHID